MNYIIIILLALGLGCFLRGIFFAQGRIKKKFFPDEGFLYWQKIIGLIYIIIIVLGIFEKNWPFVIAAAISAILDFLFYLQPTPRISKVILYFVIAINMVFALYIIWTTFI